MTIDKISTVVSDIFHSEPNTVSIAIIEGVNDIVFSTENWNISKAIKDLNTVWTTGDPNSVIINNIEGRINISGNVYTILQVTPERLVAVNIGKKEEGIIGFKDDEFKIVCKINFEVFIPKDDLGDLENEEDRRSYVGDLATSLTQTSIFFKKLSSKKRYMAEDASLGKDEIPDPISLKILSHTTKLMQKIGLEQFGMTSDEAQVYLALLEKGNSGAKVGSINKKLDIKRPTIYKILDKLQEKNWLKRVIESGKSPKRFVAKPINELVNSVIQEKREELKILESFSLLMGESLEKSSFNLEKLGITGVDKDCGLIIFEFDYNVAEDIDLIEHTVKFFNDKMEFEIKKNRIADLKEIVTRTLNHEDSEIKAEHEYRGARMFLKFNEGSTTANNLGTKEVKVSEQVAIPIDDKIYVIWGTPEKFPLLLDIIQKL